MTDQSLDQHPPDPRLAETVAPPPVPISSRIPERIGRYHVKRVIASGGMGTVYEATQDNPRRVVAVKVMKQGIASKSALRRFEYEAQILARLRHPGIAQIYEAGTYVPDPTREREARAASAKRADAPSNAAFVPEAVPYFAMEYIPNAKSITSYADEKKLGMRPRLELFTQVCDAVHHGHQKGIIHRDLKPGNVLVTADPSPLPLSRGGSGGLGQVKIIDFGVARGTDSDLAVTTLQTDVGQLVGTLQYMSPEQCEGDPQDIDTRSDVYALGVVLYEMLSGKLPYEVSRSKIFDGTRMIREQQPSKLSTVDKSLRGDVETIVFKALEKDRDRRYQSAGEFAHDIHRYLTGEAILARRASIIYQLRVFARRNKAVVASLAAVFVVLIAGIIVSTSLYVRAERARDEKARERDTARAVTAYLSTMLRSADPNQGPGPNITVREMIDKVAAEVSTVFKDQPLVEAALHTTIGTTYQSMGQIDNAERHLRAGLEIRNRELPSDHPERADSLYHLGWFLTQDKGDQKGAEALLRESLDVRRKLYGNVHADVANSLMGIGNVMISQDHAAMLQAAREVLDIRLKLHGREHHDVADALITLAQSLYLSGDYRNAEPLYEEGCAIYRRLPGDRLLDFTMSLHFYGLLLFEKGDYDKAEPLLREALEFWRNVYRNEHPWAPVTLRVMTRLFRAKGDLKSAERLAHEAVACSRKKDGGGSLQLGSSLVELALVLQGTGQHEAARVACDEALEIRREAVKRPNASEYAMAWYAQCLLDCASQDPSSVGTALTFAQKALEISKGKNGPLLDTLAAAYHLSGNNEKAVESQELAVALFPHNHEFVTRLANYRELVAKEQSRAPKSPSQKP